MGNRLLIPDSTKGRSGMTDENYAKLIFLSSVCYNESSTYKTKNNATLYYRSW